MWPPAVPTAALGADPSDPAPTAGARGLLGQGAIRRRPDHLAVRMSAPVPHPRRGRGPDGAHTGVVGVPGIEGKVVAITGASSGIGQATAIMLAARGAQVVLGARRADRLESVAERIRAAGGEAAVAVVDVRSRQQVAGLVETAVERFGRLDVFSNNAGIGPISPLDELRVEQWEDMVDVNVKGVLYGIAAA
jgi:hypothetical protein